MSHRPVNPLVSSPPKEVPLANAPLVRVVAQVRFPLIVSVEKSEFIAPFQESLRKEYPVLREEQSQNIELTHQGVQTHTNRIWRFGEVSGGWKVSLAANFVALETTSYTSRSDFLGRLERVLIALSSHVRPATVERVGIRYIDRLELKDPRELERLVVPELAGIVPLELGAHALHALSDTLFQMPDGITQLRARWGLVPPGATMDPSAIEPVNVSTWLLDVDIFSMEQKVFEAEALLEQARRFTERHYAFFRWAVTNEFLQKYGG